MEDLEPVDVSKHQWEFYGAMAKALYISIYPPFYTHGFKERYGMPIDILNVYQDGKVLWFMRADQMEALALKVLPTFLKKMWEYYDQWQRELKDFEDHHERFRELDISTLDDVGRQEAMRAYREAFGKPFVTNNIVETLSFYFQSNLHGLLMAEGIGQERAEELIHEYGQAARPTYLKIAAQEYRNATTAQVRDVVAKKYNYVFNDYQGVQKITDEDLQKLVESTPYEFAAELKTKGISDRAQDLLTVTQIIATIQDVRKGAFLQMVYAASLFGEDYARRRGIAYEEVERATWAEVEEGIIDGKELALRASPYVVYWTLEDVSVHKAEEAKKIIEDINAHVFVSDSQQAEVKGVCASKGVVRGRAVVIFDPKDFHRVQPGDVIVTIMTRPEFLPVMRIAAAFVCDEGGLTSHAAIVAREMKKPCVIGTKIGSRIFKDGDMVEVDANAGIVRKI